MAPRESEKPGAYARAFLLFGLLDVDLRHLTGGVKEKTVDRRLRRGKAEVLEHGGTVRVYRRVELHHLVVGLR